MDLLKQLRNKEGIEEESLVQLEKLLRRQVWIRVTTTYHPWEFIILRLDLPQAVIQIINGSQTKGPIVDRVTYVL